MEDNSGINVLKMDQLIMDINDYNEKIKKTLSDISDLIEKTKSYYSSKESTSYVAAFNNFKTNNDIILKNIKSYADDMVRLKGKYSNVESEIAGMIKLKKIDIEKEFAGVNYEHK